MSATPPTRYRSLAILICLGVVLATLVLHRHAVATRAYPDMDDVLRLVEVRDWLGGQGFYDVSQHRMNMPAGAPMHWSRLVDLPLAAVMLALRPLIGAARAELVATVAVPLATLAAILLLTGGLARRLAGDRAGLAAIALTGLAVPATMQAQPLRIDHHGWEIVLALLATRGLLSRGRRRGGMVAGAAIAVALQISLEALPYAVALGGVAALAWWCDPCGATRVRLRGYVAALTGVTLLLFVLFRAPADLGGHCDAVSPPHLLGLMLATVGVLAATSGRIRGRGPQAGALLVTATIAAIGFRVVPPHCGVDAFSALEPIVRTDWYDQVGEGMPVWHQGLPVIAAGIGFPLVGLACALAAWRRERREAWALYALLLLAATMVAGFVQRAGGVANALAVPGAAWAMLALVDRVGRDRRMPVRVIGSVAIVCLLSPLAPSAAVLVAAPAPAPGGGVGGVSCASFDAVHRLDTLPAGRVFAPLDAGPMILLATRHAVLASGHHRNHAAMAEALRAWLGSDEAAHAILRRHRLGYVLLCPALGEVGFYRTVAPDGFAAHLAAGRAPGWLAPVAVPGAPLPMWRVIG